MIPHSQPSIGEEEIAAVSRVLASGHLAQGREVAAFEEACAAAVGRRHGVAVSSGTAALHLTLLCAGISAGKRVAIPAYSCAALIHAVQWTGATPVLVDCGDSVNMDAGGVPASVDAAVMVHLFGEPAARPEAPFVVEDLAQSVGGPTGRQGHAAVLSFYATKLMTTGEGGMVLTDDAGLAEEARDRRDYDNRDDLKPRLACKMTDVQAALGQVQLRRLPAFIAARRGHAAAYREGLRGLPLGLPDHPDHVYFRYVVETSHLEALAGHLNGAGIEAKRPVYRPLHHYTEDACPRAERAHQRNLSLPIYPAMGSQEIQTVLDSIIAFFAEGPGRHAAGPG